MEPVSAVPEVQIGGNTAIKESVPPEFSGKWQDMDKDMAAIAKEMQPAQPEASAQAAVTTPVAPAETKAEAAHAATPAPAAEAPKATEVPEKFRGPDGKLDQDKILKSYRDAERALHQAQNAKATAQPAQASQPAAHPQQVPAGNLSPFEAQVAQDLINDAAAYGYQMPPGQAIAQARSQIRLAEARLEAEKASTFSRVAQLEQTLQEKARMDELHILAKDPQTNWVLTPEGQAEMIKARQENSYLNQSAEPWRAAALYVLANRTLQGPSVPVMTNPTGVQQTAPQLPVTPAQQAVNSVRLDTPSQVEAYVKNLTPEQEDKFWQSQGLKWSATRPSGFAPSI